MRTIKHLTQKGSALLSALFIMTLVAIATTAMTLRLQMDIYRTQLTLDSDRLYLASQAVTFWAMDTLNDPKKRFTQIYNQGQVADFPKSMQNLYPEVKIQGQLYDAQGFFNISNINKEIRLRFSRLLSQVLPNKDAQHLAVITFALENWVTPLEASSKEQDVYLNYYLKQNPPYLPSHQPLASISELRLIEEVSAEDYLALLPFITVLPEEKPININTASKNVLFSINLTLTEAKVEEILQARGKEGIKEAQKLNDLINKLALSPENVTIESHYFLCVAKVSRQDLHFIKYSLFERRKEENGQLTVHLISESFNTL